MSEQDLEKTGLFNNRYIRKLAEEDRKGFVNNAYRTYKLLMIELGFGNYSISLPLS